MAGVAEARVLGSPTQSTRRLILWLPLWFIVLSGAALTAILLLMRTEAIYSGERLTRVLAKLTEDQTTRTLQAVDQTLLLARNHLGEPADAAATADFGAVSRVYASFLDERPYLRAIFVLDAGGRIIVDTNNASVGRDISDREFFQHHRQRALDEFAIGSPVVSRMSGNPIVVATRPRLRGDGQFAGVIGAVIDPTYFGRVWSSDDMDVQSTTTLLQRDGTLLSRSPPDRTLIGRNFGNRPVFHNLPDHPAGTLLSNSPVDGAARIVSYRTLDAYPDLVVIVSQAQQSVLGTWRRYAVTSGASWLAAALALAALAYWLQGEGRRRERAEEDASLSRDRLTAVINSSVDGIITIDEHGTILSFSAPAERTFGYAAEEAVGRNVSMLMAQPELYPGADSEAKKGGIVETGKEVNARRKDGSVVPIDLAIGEIPTTGGQRQFVGTVRDISKHKAMEEQLRQAQKMEVVGQLTGGIAHDFNNLLGIMLGNVELARDEGDAAKRNDLLARALHAVRRSAELTGRLLAFSRRQTLLPQQVDINAMVLDMAALLRRTLGETVQVEAQVTSQPLYAHVDPGQLENALLNLAVNARDAMAEGGTLSMATGSIHLDDEFAGSHAEVTPGAYRTIAVSDNGTGMAADVLRRVFEPFFTTKEVGKGSGLGLSMVYGFAKQSGGHVSIYSEVGRGTTVRLYLPVSADVAEEEQLVPRQPPTEFGEDRTILVVEDEPGVRTLVASMVQKMGFRPILAADGPQALEELENAGQIDLMISDVVLPRKMSGLELAAIVRTTRPQLPLIFISGYSDETETLAEVVQAGDTLLGKPFSRTQLADAIRSAMGGSRVGTGQPS